MSAILPPCPECGATPTGATRDQIEVPSPDENARFASGPEMHLVPCGCLFDKNSDAGREYMAKLEQMVTQRLGGES